MNTNKTVLSIIDRLKPAKQAVKLSALSEIEDNLDRFEAAELGASYLAYEYGDQIIDAYDNFRQSYPLDDYIINGATRDLEEVTENMQNALNELEAKSEELGIDPSDVYPDFYELKDRVDSADVLNQDAKEKYYEVISYAGFNDFWR